MTVKHGSSPLGCDGVDLGLGACVLEACHRRDVLVAGPDAHPQRAAQSLNVLWRMDRRRRQEPLGVHGPLLEQHVDNIGWRGEWDPIVFTEALEVDDHVRTFRRHLARRAVA